MVTEYIKAKMFVSDLWFLEKNIWSPDINRFTVMLLCLPENVILSNISRVASNETLNTYLVQRIGIVDFGIRLCCFPCNGFTLICVSSILPKRGTS
jgi:hypothetical protein